jgi:hypothetical protein
MNLDLCKTNQDRADMLAAAHVIDGYEDIASKDILSALEEAEARGREKGAVELYEAVKALDKAILHIEALVYADYEDALEPAKQFLAGYKRWP